MNHRPRPYQLSPGVITWSVTACYRVDSPRQYRRFPRSPFYYRLRPFVTEGRYKSRYSRCSEKWGTVNLPSRSAIVGTGIGPARSPHMHDANFRARGVRIRLFQPRHGAAPFENSRLSMQLSYQVLPPYFRPLTRTWVLFSPREFLRCADTKFSALAYPN